MISYYDFSIYLSHHLVIFWLLVSLIGFIVLWLAVSNRWWLNEKSA
jgi:hypothetical protein